MGPGDDGFNRLKNELRARRERERRERLKAPTLVVTNPPKSGGDKEK
jgi:hypothetical protein